MKRAKKIVHKKTRVLKSVHKKRAKPKLAKTKKISKSHQSARVPAGIPNFDKLIEGGFEKNSTNLLVGGSGIGKSIFAMQFLIEGLKRGEKWLYVTFEEQKEQFYHNMSDFGWNLDEYEKKGAFIFLEYSPVKVRTMLEEGGGEIQSIILKEKISRLVIDSLTSFELLFEDLLAKREAALALFNMTREWECTVILTLEEEVSIKGRVASKTLEFESDSIIVFYYFRIGKERGRFVEVIKMRGTNHSKEIYKFEIDKKGVTVGKKPVTNLNR